MTLVTAIVSELTGIPAKRDVAMTGEVTLHGKVLPIGGLREKTMAAFKAGITKVLVPAANQKDMEDIDPEVKEKLTFVFCETVDDVLKQVLCPIEKENSEEKLPTTLPKSENRRGKRASI